MAEPDPEYPGYASVLTPEARATRATFPEELRLKAMEMTDLLATDPQAFQNRTQKLRIGRDAYVYEHPDHSFQITFQLFNDEDPKLIKFVHFAALRMPVKKTLFISYSHEDMEFLEKLKKHLKRLEAHDMAIWDDRQIKAGARWREEIERALAVARAALLLVSPDFLDSDFISKQELPSLLSKAQTEGLKIFWVPVRPSKVSTTPIAEFQAAVENPAKSLADFKTVKREQQYARIAERIQEAMDL